MYDAVVQGEGVLKEALLVLKVGQGHGMSPARLARMERVRALVRDTLPLGSSPARPPRPGQLAD